MVTRLCCRFFFFFSNTKISKNATAFDGRVTAKGGANCFLCFPFSMCPWEMWERVSIVVFALILVYLNFCFICGGNAACCINTMHYWQYFIARYQARNIFRSISIACRAAMHVKCISTSTHRLHMFQRLQQLLSLMKLKMLNYWTIKMLNELMNPTNGQLYYSLTCSLYSNVGGRERKVKRSTVVTK